MPLMKSFAGSGLMLLCSLAVSCPGAAAPLITYRLDTPRTGLVTPVAAGQASGARGHRQPQAFRLGRAARPGRAGNPSQTIEAGSVAVPGRCDFVRSLGGCQGRRSPSKRPAWTHDFRRVSENAAPSNPNSGSTVVQPAVNGRTGTPVSGGAPGVIGRRTVAAPASIDRVDAAVSHGGGGTMNSPSQTPRVSVDPGRAPGHS